MKNISAISYMRVAALQLIVAYHSLCCYTGVWGMEACIIPFYQKFYLVFCFVGLHSFVFIAGFLYAYLTYKENRYQKNIPFLLNKAKRLLVPYAIWELFMLVVFHQTIYDFFAGTSHLWFLLMLFVVFFIVTITKKIWYKASKTLNVVLLVALLIIWFVKDIVLKISITGTGNKAIIYLPVFFLGMLMAKYDIVEKIREHKLLVHINNVILFVLLSVLIFINRQLYANDYLNLYCYLIPPFLLIMFDSLVSQQKESSVVSNLDRNSMGIYILHQIFVSFLIAYGGESLFRIFGYWGPLIIFTVIFSVSWGISSVINKFKIASYLFG